MIVKFEYIHTLKIHIRYTFNDALHFTLRLIKGDGEILEEIVTRDRHKQINQEATRSDGLTYQRNTVGAARK